MMSPTQRTLAVICLQFAQAAEQMGGHFYLGAANMPTPELPPNETGIFLLDEDQANGPAEFGNDWLFSLAEAKNAMWAIWEAMPDPSSALLMSTAAVMSGRPLIVIVTDKNCGPKWVDFVRPHWLVREGERGGFLPFNRETPQ